MVTALKSDHNCDIYYRNECRSCSLMEISRKEGLSRKELGLAKILSQINQASYKQLPIFSPQRYLPSRVKAKLSVHGSHKEPIIGLARSDLSRTELLDCPLHLPILNAVLRTVKELITSYELTPYSIEYRSGELKGLVLLTNRSSDSLIARFVLRSKELLPKIELLIPELKAKHPEIKVITANLQPIPHAIVEGPEEIILTAEKIIWEKYGDAFVAFGPQSFIQVTPETAENLYLQAREKIREYSPKKVLDLFCGSGCFSLVAGDIIPDSLGLEISQTSIDCAELAAARNNLAHHKYRVADLENANLSDQACDLLIANPPRRGLGQEVIKWIRSKEISHFLYSSCNPQTLAQDLRALSERYRLIEVAPFDMFPLTDHVEVLAVLEKF